MPTGTIAYNSYKMPQTKSDNSSSDAADARFDVHIPVLLGPVLQYLQPQPGESYADLTAGYGGHAAAILRVTESPGRAVLVDRDTNAISALRARFRDLGSGAGGADVDRQGPGTDVPVIRHQDFYQASRELAADGARFNMILADLGVSSPHMDQPDRGFSLASDGPLDMRMDQRQALTAADVVNSYSADELADILKRYGEEPKSRQIAESIVRTRRTERITTTHQLAQIAARAWPGHSRVHPATRTFQALRIAVNDELRMVEDSLPLWIELLAPGGRLVVISFHSLEDRLVKQAFAFAGGGGDRYDAALRILTKRPVVAGPDEIATNPRARSAKLRAAVKN